MSVAPEMVVRLGQVALAAKDAGLKSMPTLITINMSGRFWWPDWMIDAQGNPADLFSDPSFSALRRFSSTHVRAHSQVTSRFERSTYLMKSTTRSVPAREMQGGCGLPCSPTLFAERHLEYRFRLARTSCR